MIVNENKCPVCGNTEHFYVTAHSSYEYGANLHVYGIGSIALAACTQCGCVYVGKRDRDQKNEFDAKNEKR